MTQKPAIFLPAGQRGGFSSPPPAARLFAAATTHNGSTSCAAQACTHGGNSAPGAEGRKPGLMLPVQARSDA